MNVINPMKQHSRQPSGINSISSFGLDGSLKDNVFDSSLLYRRRLDDSSIIADNISDDVNKNN